jgi:hypothetical protein
VSARPRRATRLARSCRYSACAGERPRRKRGTAGHGPTVAERRSAIHSRTSPKGWSKGSTSPSATDREDRRHERRGIHDARHLGRTLIYWPHLAGGFLTRDTLQPTTRSGLRIHWSRPPTTSSPARVPPSSASSRLRGPRATARRPSATAGRSAKFSRNEKGEKRRSPATLRSWRRKGRSASTCPSPQRHSPDDSVQEDEWPTTPRPRSARATTG